MSDQGCHVHSRTSLLSAVSPPRCSHGLAPKHLPSGLPSSFLPSLSSCEERTRREPAKLPSDQSPYDSLPICFRPALSPISKPPRLPFFCHQRPPWQHVQALNSALSGQGFLLVGFPPKAARNSPCMRTRPAQNRQQTTHLHLSFVVLSRLPKSSHEFSLVPILILPCDSPQTSPGFLLLLSLRFSFLFFFSRADQEWDRSCEWGAHCRPYPKMKRQPSFLLREVSFLRKESAPRLHLLLYA